MKKLSSLIFGQLTISIAKKWTDIFQKYVSLPFRVYIIKSVTYVFYSIIYNKYNDCCNDGHYLSTVSVSRLDSVDYRTIN
jgi:hypothetical protein